MKIQKILILDDDLYFINELEEMLIQNDFLIIKKTNTNDIVKFVKTGKPDLIILDLKINGLTGIDVAKLIKNDPKSNGLPMILLTNYYVENENKYNKDNLKFGINVCLKKTIKPEILIDEIRKIEFEI